MKPSMVPPATALPLLAPPRASETPVARPPTPDVQALRKTAQDFEAAFIAEMLKHTGLGQPRSGIASGPGQDVFSGFITRTIARDIAARGDFGLAEGIFRALAERASAGHDPHADTAVEDQTS